MHALQLHVITKAMTASTTTTAMLVTAMTFVTSEKKSSNNYVYANSYAYKRILYYIYIHICIHMYVNNAKKCGETITYKNIRTYISKCPYEHNYMLST